MKTGMYDPMSFACSINQHDNCYHMDGNSMWCSCDCHDKECMCNHHFYERKKLENEQKEILIKQLDTQIVDLILNLPKINDPYLKDKIQQLYHKYFNLREALGWSDL